MPDNIVCKYKYQPLLEIYVPESYVKILADAIRSKFRLDVIESDTYVSIKTDWAVSKEVNDIIKYANLFIGYAKSIDSLNISTNKKRNSEYSDIFDKIEAEIRAIEKADYNNHPLELVDISALTGTARYWVCNAFDANTVEAYEDTIHAASNIILALKALKSLPK